MDSLTSLTPKIRHPTWSHSQHKEHRCLLKSEQFRARSTSVSRSTQTGSSTCEDDHDDGLAIVLSGHVEVDDGLVIGMICSTEHDIGLAVGSVCEDDLDDGLILKVDSCFKDVQKISMDEDVTVNSS